MSGSRARRVLVVDDNDDVRETLTELLRLLGHEVAGAASGTEALEQAPAYAPEIVLLDLGLPDVDGCEVARRMRDLPAYDATVLIALTGYGQDEDKRRVAEAGFDMHLIKPIEPSDLEKVIASAKRGV
jgi:CheY-like chemotaxis protein